METSITELYNLYRVVKGKGLALASLYEDYYGRLSPGLSREIYDSIQAAAPDLSEAERILKANGYGDDDLGIVWLPYIIAAGIMSLSYLGDRTLRYLTERLRFKEKQFDALTSAGLTEMYYLEQKQDAPGGLTDSAKIATAGFGLGTIAALALVGWALFSGRKTR